MYHLARQQMLYKLHVICKLALVNLVRWWNYVKISNTKDTKCVEEQTHNVIRKGLMFRKWHIRKVQSLALLKAVLSCDTTSPSWLSSSSSISPAHVAGYSGGGFSSHSPRTDLQQCSALSRCSSARFFSLECERPMSCPIVLHLLETFSMR